MPSTDIKITEIMYKPSAGTASEFEYLELTNTGTGTIDIAGWAIGNSDFIPEGFVPFDTPTLLGAGESAALVPMGMTRTAFEGVYGALPDGAQLVEVMSFGIPGGGLGLDDYFNTVTLIDAASTPVASIYYADTVTAGNSFGVTYDPLTGDAILTEQTPTPGGIGSGTPPPAPTEGDDDLIGTTGSDEVDLLGGRDTFFGLEGDDTITGGFGNDRIDGGEDNDTIELGSGNDHGWGGAGDDILYGGTGADQVNGNSGDDILYGGKGGDTIRGGKGEDEIHGGRQSDEIYGGAQSDEIFGGVGHDLIYGEEGKDTIDGGSGNDLIYGGIMDDFIFGAHGRDEAYGGAGDDQLFGGRSDDRLFGDDGQDILDGGRGNDVLMGGAGNDALFGGAQGDQLFGGAGDDVIDGGLANDQLTGNAGADIFEFRGTFNHDIITDFGNGADRVLLGAELGAWDIDALLTQNTTEVDGNTVIDLKGWGSITLEGVSPTDLTAEDFIVELPIEPLG